MPNYLIADDPAAVPVRALDTEAFKTWLGTQDETVKRWLEGTGFKAEAGQVALIPGADGELARVVFGVGTEVSLWDWAGLPTSLPPGRVFRAEEPSVADMAALGWALGSYRFDRYRKRDDEEKEPAQLVWPEGCDRSAVARAARATRLVRDLINTPAEDMGPERLAETARVQAAEHGADCDVITGDALLEAGYPAIHAVGRAADEAPRLIDLRWGPESGPKVTLVGKGVCFDSGGLDLKTASGMRLMKKDMGGAAHALGLAEMVMSAELPVRLRVLIPAVENSVAGNALRPGDVVATRRGLSVEIGNTDAEGRVILADALAEAADEEPEAILDFATLTGAARVALGTELPALFCNDDDMAAALLAHGRGESDPLWRLPLWAGYRKQVESSVADLTNAPEGSYGGAITAALFLERFIDAETPANWAHVDLMGWNTSSKPGRPEGGEAMGLRAAFSYLQGRYGS